MAGKSKNDKSRQTCVVQVCLTPEEKDLLALYARSDQAFNGKLSVAGRALVQEGLSKRIGDLAVSSGIV